MERAKDLALWLYWFPFKTLVQSMSMGSVYRLGRAMGTVLCRLSAKRKTLEREWMNLLVGVRDVRNMPEDVREAFIVLLQNELEVLRYPTFDPAIVSDVVTCEGLDHLNQALSAGKGAMLLFAHFGANQMIMPAIGYRNYRMNQLSAPPTVWKDKRPDKRFTAMGEKALALRWAHEQSLPVAHINIFGSLKEAFRCLKRNEVLGVAIDGGGGTDRVAVNFMAQRMMLSTGPMEIAARTACAVLPTFMVRGRDGRHTLVIEPPLPRATDESTMAANIQRFAGRLGDYVARYPSHYLHFLALRAFMAKIDGAPLVVSV